MLCEPLRCQNAGSERTDLATDISLELHCGVALRLRHLHRWIQGIKLSRLDSGHELHVCWALLDSIDTALRCVYGDRMQALNEQMWRMNSVSSCIAV